MKRICKFALALVFILALSSGFAGCGSGDDFDASTMTIGSSTSVDTLNPLSSQEQQSFEILQLVYDPLVRYDDALNPAAGLADDWKVSKDEKTWTFHLNEAAKWHDGQPVTSQDVKYTYELMLDTGLGYMYSSYLEGITDIACPDEQTVVIKTKAPKANMLMNTTPILPKHIWEKVKKNDLETWDNAEMIGSGPYKFVSSSNGVVKVSKNEDFYGTKPSVENYVFVEYKNTDSLAQALKVGEIDGAVNLSATQYSQLEEDENITMISGEVQGFMQVGINCSKDPSSKGNPLLKDAEIRKAIEYATDKQNIIDMAYQGHGTEGTTLVNAGDQYHYEPKGEELRSYSIDKASQLLDKAGYKDKDGDGIREDASGNQLSFEFINIGDNSAEVKTGQLIAATCKKAGIEINLKTMDSGALQDAIMAADYDMFMWGWGGDYDPTVILGLLTTGQIGGNNEPQWSNEEYDELYLKQQEEIDERARIKMVQKMQKIAYDEAPYIILLYDNNIQGYRSDRWEGIKQIPEKGTYYFNMTIGNYINAAPVK